MDRVLEKYSWFLGKTGLQTGELEDHFSDKQKRIEMFGLANLLDATPGLIATEPLSYIRFMGLVHRARLIITDSGGLQEETTYLDIPCLTLRENTERPITVTQGTNKLVRSDGLAENVARVLAGEWPQGTCPPLWDGQTASRAVAALKKRAGL